MPPDDDPDEPGMSPGIDPAVFSNMPLDPTDFDDMPPGVEPREYLGLPGSAPVEVVDDLDAGDRVRIHFMDRTTTFHFQPENPFETEVRRVQTSEPDDTKTVYRAEFEPDEEDPNAEYYYLEKTVPEEDSPFVSGLRAAKGEGKSERTWLIDTASGIEIL